MLMHFLRANSSLFTRLDTNTGLRKNNLIKNACGGYNIARP
jgi:hypothetical protein